MALKLDILSPSQVLFRGEADEVVAPSAAGEVGILPQHTEYLTTLKEGQIRMKSQGQIKEYTVRNGLCSVVDNYVTILVETL